MNGRKTLATVAVLVLLFGISLTAQAQKYGRSTFLGQASVDGGNDHDTITVGKADGKFHALQIQVQRGAIEFQRVVVHYGNGTEEALDIKQKINAGGSTRWVDLQGNERTIKSVDFWYSKANWGSKKPTVRLYGR